MPYLKTENLSIQTEMGQSHVKIKLNVNTNGVFYCNLDNELLPSIQGVFDSKNYEETYNKKREIKVFNGNLESLIGNIKTVYKNFMTPKITKEPVILYNIESHVSFAQDEEGNIFPNAGFEGARWTMEHPQGRDMFGGHYASQPSEGGYSITIGAEAKLKIIYKYGDNEKIKYENYYKGGSHHGHDNPAELLNSWCSFSLGNNFKEIPYSDEGALFFHKLMLGMASLSQLIQNSTFEQDKLLSPVLCSKCTRLSA